MTDTSLAHRLRRRLRRVFAPEAHARDLNDELRFHLEMEIDHNVRSGMSPEAARAGVLREMGLHGEYRDRAPGSTRGASRTAFVELFARDVRLAARSLRRAP